MKITAVRSYFIGMPYEHGAPKPVLATANGRTTQDAVYVRVDTDSGVTGWGEAFGFGACAMSHLAVETVVAPLAMGREIGAIEPFMEDLWRRTQGMSRNGPVAFALSGLEIALWDLIGKEVGQPVHALLGGARRTEIPAYASLLRIGTPELVAQVCRRAIDRGFREIKLHERTIEAVAAARAAVGPDVKLMLDTNCTWGPEQAGEMAAQLKPFDLAWLEEPVFPPDDFLALAELRRSGIPIAAGENTGNVMDVRHMLALGAVDILQPDLAKMGGISAMMQAVRMAEGAGVELHPHSPLFGPSLAATLHVLAVAPVERSCEFYFADLEANPVGSATTPAGGKFHVLAGPGLGITVDEGLLEKYRIS